MNRIKELRTEKGLTQTQLASLLGINQTAVGKYERGELEPNLQNLTKLSLIFECSVDYIICNADDLGNIVIHKETPAPQLSGEEKDLLENYRKLPSGLKIRAQAFLSGMVEALPPEKKKTSGS